MLDRAARVVAPISGVQAHLFTTMADTFDAFSRDPAKLEQTIQKSPGTLDALVGLQGRAAHDVVDRSDPEAVGHPCHDRKAAFDRRFTSLKPQMELGKCVLRQDARRPARRVDVEAPDTDEIRRSFEGRRVQRADVAVDSARDDCVVGRDPVEVVPVEESTLRPFRLVPVDPDDPSAARS